MNAIILAGGFGTRLRSVISDIPKPLAPINGTPFIKFILKKLSKYSINRINISVCYMAEKIENACGKVIDNIPINYTCEKEPLGTGGAIKLCISESKIDDDEYILILNGDTFFDIDIERFVLFAQENNADITIAAKFMENCFRYGNLVIQDRKIKGFNSSGTESSAYINGGIYLIKPKVLNQFKSGEKFSFEKDFLEKITNIFDVYAYETNNYFIDIGIPEDYSRSQKELEDIVK